MPKKQDRKAPSPPKTKPRGRSEAPLPAEVTTGLGRSPFYASNEDLERSLLTGESRGQLEDYFGPANYAELRELQNESAKRSVRGGPRVLILPGIMGSTLGKKGPLGITDILWLNPVEIALGKLSTLKLDGGATPYHASGVILLAYLKLKLRLKIGGFDADFYPFDWRLSLDQLGAQLADAVAKEPAAKVSLVAHSMGGLVARAALAQTGDKVSRLIMLGTPNYGSFAPVQVLRAAFDTVQKIASLDRVNSIQDLCSQVFNTFPGLYQMLPAADKFTAVNLYDGDVWPKQGTAPRPEVLAGVKAVVDQLAPADSRFFLIAGVNKSTVTGLSVKGEEFAYEVSTEGDGTVPLAYARLAGLSEQQVYYVDENHGSLPNNRSVGRAVQDLLATGTTSVLSNTRPAPSRDARVLSEPQMLAAVRAGIAPGQFGSSDLRHLLDAVASPDSSDQTSISVAAAGAGATSAAPNLTQQFQNLVIGRRQEQRIEITLARGDITEVESRAYVLGLFRNVAPSGAANAIDQKMDGAIAEFTARRMFSGDVGEVFLIPLRRNALRADMVLFAGLGAFDRFNSDVQQLVAENIIRVMVRSGVDEFATLLIGAGSGQSAATVLQNLLAGFFRGLRDADRRHRFRGITLCESNQDRYLEMKAELFRLAGTELFRDIEVTLDEIEVPPPPELAGPRVLRAGAEPVYVIVRQEGTAAGSLHFRASVLGAGFKAAVFTGSQDMESAALDSLLSGLDRAVQDPVKLEAIGKQLAETVLAPEIRTVLGSMKDRHMVMVHDAAAARVPWEILNIDGWNPAVEAGLSRRYLADNLPIVSWLEQRRVEQTLNVLLIVNPLGNLPGAEQEGARIVALAKATAGINVKACSGPEATKAAIVSALRSGVYDVVHYAGHAFFDEVDPARSGLVCAGQEVLSGADLIGISNLPFLVFFNACEAGRVRGEPPPPDPTPSQRAHESYGVAEALMRGGISNYMSTYWPVNDDAAGSFSETFYKALLDGGSIGSALLEGRKKVRDLPSPDWADYILYGSYDFILKQKPRG